MRLLPITTLIACLSGASTSAAQPTNSGSQSLRFDQCREVTLVFRNVSAETEPSLLPSGFIARRNQVGRPIVWLENMFCESIEVDGIAVGAGSYTFLLAGIIAPDTAPVDPTVALHFYIAHAVTSVPALQKVLSSVGISAEVTADTSIAAPAADRATVTVGGASPFVVTFVGEIPTTVHTHNWYFWHASDMGRTVLHVDFAGEVGSRGTGRFEGTTGTRLDEFLRNQPVMTALNEPSSARVTVTVVEAHGQSSTLR